MPRSPYTKQSKYSRLRPEDVAIWERFIDKYPAYYESVEYDFKVGSGREYPSHFGEVIKNGATEHSRKRVDVIGYKGNEIHVIEVKPNASGNALGQVVEYTVLFREQYHGTETIVPVILTDITHPDTEHVAMTLGIKILIA